MENQATEDLREYTIKIIPHQGETVHSIRLPMKLIRHGAATFAAGALLFVGAFGYAAYSAFTIMSDAQELRELRKVNVTQQEQLSALAKKANALQDEVEQIHHVEQELRQMAGADLAPAEALPVPEAQLPADAPVEPPFRAAPAPPMPAASAAPAPAGTGGPWIAPDVRHIDKALDNVRERLAASRANLEQYREAFAKQQERLAIHRELSAHTPSLWPAAGEVSSPYGLRWGGSDFHPGIDIANDYGTPIVAAADGIVTEAGWNSGGYGNMVDIDHGNGIWTRYGHAEAVAVSAGDEVKKGQVIAYMGSTGFSTGPHVHYEVHVNGEAVNPAPYLGGE